VASGAYRDTGAAIERAEALEREVEELRAEIARLEAKPNDRRPNKERERLPPNVEALENEVINLRAENELLRSQLDRSPQPEPAERERGSATDGEEIAALRSELDAAHRAIEVREHEIDRLRSRLESEGADNRDAVIKRLTEEREELERELKEARERYEAEPPASRDPKTFEDKVLRILSRLVK
jgi:predicted  nucleic acid-binding Zn-ribbon protein